MSDNKGTLWMLVLLLTVPCDAAPIKQVFLSCILLCHVKGNKEMGGFFSGTVYCFYSMLSAEMLRIFQEGVLYYKLFGS